MKTVLAIFHLFISITVFSQSKAFLNKLLPENNQILNWSLVDTLRCYEANQLFSMIDGGADIYLEYGFERVVAAQYQNSNKKVIQVEIYEMKSDSSAFGIFSFTSGKSGIPLGIGNGALEFKYYLNFWKDKYFVSITNLENSDESVKAKSDFANWIDQKILNKGKTPLLLTILPEENLSVQETLYLKGNVALSNLYPFDSEDIFNVQQAIAGIYDDAILIALKYDSNDQSLKQYGIAKQKMKKNKKYKKIMNSKTFMEFSEQSGKTIYCESYKEFILIYLGNKKQELNNLISQIKKKIL